MLNNFVSVEGKVHFGIGLKDPLTQQKLWYVFDCAAPKVEEDPKNYEKRLASYKKLAFKCYKKLEHYTAFVETAAGLEPVKEVK